MRLQGRFIDWRDEKGFGFIRPHDGHEQAFAVQQCSDVILTKRYH